MKSDKENSLVVLDTEKYFLFGHQFFNGDNFIRSKNENEQKFNQMHLYLNKLLKEGKIDKKFQKTRNLQLLGLRLHIFFSKTHKSDFVQNLKYRPIISSYNSYCSNLSKELSRLLCLEFSQIKKGTFDFLENLRK